MPRGRPAPALAISVDQLAELTRMARSSTLPHRKVVEAKALLAAADGVGNEEIARRCSADSDTIRRWRKRFVVQGPAGWVRWRPQVGGPLG